MGTIVIVEDDEDILALLRELFEEEGWNVVVCQSGTEALGRIALRPPDLVLLDVILPSVDGATVLAALRQDPRTAQVPVVVMTATTVGPDDLPGADALIRKPFAVDELIALAARLLGRSRRYGTSSLPDGASRV